MLSNREKPFASAWNSHVQGNTAKKTLSAVTLLAVSLNLGLSSTQVVMAQSRPGATPMTHGAHASTLNFDLSSTNRTLQAPVNLGDNNISIRSGTGSRVIDAQSLLTPAERLAVWQVISTGAQTIRLGMNGNAIGGSFSLSPKFNFDISSLVIPKGVTSFSSVSNLNILGDLTNSGALRISNLIGGATISAANIVNNYGALISSATALNLIAAGSITNYGQITGANSLTFTAGNTISNIGHAGLANAGVITAANGLNLVSSNIVNSGALTTIAGNLNVLSALPSSININNTNGVLSALAADINVRDSLFSGKYNTTLMGGDLLSNNVNIFGGNGNVEMNTHSATGQVNITASNIHAGVNSGTFNLGNMTFTEDPVFFNTNGSLSVNSAISGGTVIQGAPVALLASGDIIGTNAGSINTLDGATGFPLFVMSGANFTVSSSATGSSSTSTQGNGDISSVFTILGPSVTGGAVDFSAFSNPISTVGTANGGNVSITAFAGTGKGSSFTPGTVNLGSVAINTNGGGVGLNNGSVTIIAGAKSDPTGGSVITVGGINTSSGGGGLAGSVYLVTATPKIEAPISITNGNITNGDSISFSTINNGSINVGSAGKLGNIAVETSPVTILAGKNINLNGSISTGGFNTISPLGPGGVVTLVAGNNIQSSTLSNFSITSSGQAKQFTASPIIMTAGASYTVTGKHTYLSGGLNDKIETTIRVVGSSSTGGNINLPTLNNITANGGPVNGNIGAAGGNVSITAFASSSNPSTTGQLSMPDVAISTGGTASGSLNVSSSSNLNGDVVIVAGGSKGSAASAPTTINLASVSGGIDTRGGNQGGGNITVVTSTPLTNASAPFVLTYNTTATSSALTSTGSLGPSANLLNAGATVGKMNAAGGYFQVPPTTGNATTATTTITVRAGGALNLNSNISNANNTLPAGGSPGMIPSSITNLESGGLMTFLNSASVSSDAQSANSTAGYGVNGGTINIRAASFASAGAIPVSASGLSGYSPYNGSGPLDATGGDGGTINITTTSTSAGAVNINNAANSFTINAPSDTVGGNGGTLNVKAALGINVTPAAITMAPSVNNLADSGFGTQYADGRGANINLTAGSTVSIAGTLNADGAPSTLSGASGLPGGNGGSINIVMNSSQAFNIGQATVGGNGVSGNGLLTANGNLGTTQSYGSGGTISVKNTGTGGIIVQGGALQVQGADATSGLLGTANLSYVGGSGGQIFLEGKIVQSTGNIDASGGSSSVARGSGDGGLIQITTNSTTPFVIDPNAVLSATFNGVKGNLTANGNVSGGGSPSGLIYSTLPTGSGGTIKVINQGGGITIGSTAVVSVAAANASSLLGTIGGDGGNILLTANGAIQSAIGLSANGGTESAPTAISASSVASTTITVSSTVGLYAGQVVGLAGLNGSSAPQNEAVAISAVLSSTQFTVFNVVNSYVSSITVQPYFTSGNGGTIVLNSNSATPFAVGTPSSASNSVGTLSATGYSGGTITVSNIGKGGIQVAASAINSNPIAPASVIGPTLIGFGGFGGNVNLLAVNGPVGVLSSISVNGVGNPTSNPSIGGFGGNIVITTNSTSAFQIGASGPSVTNGVVGSLISNGGSGVGGNGDAGTITVTNLGTGGISATNGSILLQPGTSTFGAAGNGGQLSLQAVKGNLAIGGGINVNGGTSHSSQFADGLGGSVSLTSNSTGAFTVNGLGVLVNGVGGVINAAGWAGGSITINNLGKGGINVASNGLSVAANDANLSVTKNGQDVGGPGGQIVLQAAQGNVLVNGSLSVNGGAQLQSNSSGNFLLSAGAGGQIAILSNSATPFTVGATTTNGVTGSLFANGSNGGVVNISAKGAGGIIVAQPTSIFVTGQAGGNCASCNGTANTLIVNGGNGGAIYLSATGTNGKVFISGNAQSGGLSASGGPAQDSSATFPAGDGIGNGGIISIVTNSTTPFNVGNAAANGNGVGTGGGGLVAAGNNGGSIGIKNLGTGGIQFDPALISVSSAGGASSVNSALPAGNGGNIDLEAPTGIITATASGNLSASATNVTAGTGSNGGSVTINAKQVNMTTTFPLTITANASTNSGDTGIGGSIFITQTTTTAAQALNIGRSTPLNMSVAGSPGNLTSGSILVSSPAGINIPGGLTSGDSSGSITLVVAGANPITQAGTTDIQTGTLNVKVGTGGTGPTGLDVNVQNLSVVSTGGNVNISSQNDLTVISATLTGSTTATMNIGVSNGDLTIAPSGPVGQSMTVVSSGPLSLSANGSGTGNLKIDGSVYAPTITLDASGGTATGGAISTGLNATIYAPNKLLLSLGVDGTSNGPISTQTALLNLTTNGSSSVSISNFGNLVVSNTTTVSTNMITIVNVGSLAINGGLKAETVNLNTITGFNSADSITLNGVVGAGTATSSVNINSAGSLQQTAIGLVSANSVSLMSMTGNIGFLSRTANSSNVYTPSGSSFNVDLVPNGSTAGSLTVTTNASPIGGAGNVYINITNSGSNPSANADFASINAGGDVYLTGNLTNGGSFGVSNILSFNGAITILNSNTSSGTINLNSNISAQGGPLTVQNNNAVGSAAINVADGVVLSGTGWLFNGLASSNSVNTQAGVALISGAFPSTPVVGSQPSNVTPSGDNSNFYYGLGANVGSADLNASSTASSTSIVLQGASANSINIGNGVVVNSTSSILNISSLDLTNAGIRNALIALQGNPSSGVSGKLSGTGTGTLNFDTTTASVPFSLANLNAMNIPSGLTLTFANFGAANPVSVNAPTTGTSKINGTINFQAVNGISTGSPTPNAFVTDAHMFFNTSVVGQVLNIASSGVISSDNNLGIYIGGSSTIAGKLSAGSFGTLGIHAGQATLATTSPTSTTVSAGTITMTKASLSAGTIGDGGVVRVFAPNVTGSGSSITANESSLWVTAGVNYQLKGVTPTLVKSGELTAFSSFTTGTTSIFTTVGVNTKIAAVSTSNINNLMLIAAGPVSITQTNPLTVAGIVLNDLSIASDKITVAPVSGFVFNMSDLGANNISFTTKELLNTAGTIYSNNSQTKVNVFATTGQALKVTMTDGINSGTVFGGNGLTITSAAGLTINGGNFTANTGLIAINESKTGMSINGATFTAGTLNGLPVAPVLTPNEIQSRGDIKITVGPGGLSTTDAATFISNGGSVSIVSTGALNLSGNYTANGGNISILNSNKVTSTTDFFANAAAVGTVATNAVGGIIEITAGTNLSQINNLSTVPGTLPTDPLFVQPEGGPPLPLGSNVAINNNASGSVNYGTGSVLQNVTAGATYNLGNSATTQSVMNLFGGGMVFSVGSGASLTMQGADLTVNSLTPISFKDRNHSTLDLEFNGDDDESGATAHVFAPGYNESLLLTGKGINSLEESGSAKLTARKAASQFTLKTGSMFMNPICDTVIHTDLADVHAKKGSLFSVSTEEGGLRVAVCSGPGHVSLHVGESEITLTAGEEVVISDHKLSEAEQGKADGIGRRHFSNYKLSANRHVSICEISLSSVIGNWSGLSASSTENNHVAKQISGKMLKTAAALHVVTQSHGAYQSRARKSEHNKRQVLVPVNYSSDSRTRLRASAE